jgi:ABC-type nitrate/sulfonate/bicarbonate transport systems, periplasmic components
MWSFVFLLVSICSFIFVQPVSGQNQETPAIGMAVEFMDHAACAYVARDKGWFKEEGLEISAYESYVTGMALAAALARGDIQVAYMCLVPAINVYANAKVPVRIVAGTHKYGYGLVVDPSKVKDVHDLEVPSIRIGCVREGGTVDLLMRKTVDIYHLDKDKILKNIRRMNPPKQVLALRTGQIDAAFLPEQWTTMAENSGLRMLLTSQDIWPNMQGSVLVVKEDLLRDHPELVKKLVKLTGKSTAWINQNRYSASAIVARQLSCAKKKVLPAKAGRLTMGLEITPQIISRSMERMIFTTDIDPRVVQDMINYMERLGYIKKGFEAKKMLDLRFLNDK